MALHVGGFALAGLALWLLARGPGADPTPVPMTAVRVQGTADDAHRGGAGAQEREDVAGRPAAPDPGVPAAVLPAPPPNPDRWAPRINPAAPGPPDPAVADRIRRSFEGLEGPRPGPGAGGPGAGPEPGRGDAGSSARRAVRWELNFRTADGRDYLAQLAALKATLVIPQPADWATFKAYRDLAPGRAAGTPFEKKDLPGLHFVDDAADSAGRLARALGLDFSPPLFLAFFPKEVEEELAAKERAYRGLREDQIRSTAFQVLIRDGKPVITVTGQVPVRP